MLNEPLEPASKPDSTAIPVQLSAPEFAQFILPPLSLPQRGPQGKSGSHKPFTYLLKVLSTGRHWKELPIDKGADGKAALHYTGVCKLLARWAEDGSLERAFRASGKPLDEAKNLALSLLHGDSSHTVAQKGGDEIGSSGHQHQTGEQGIAVVENHGYGLSPLTVAPVNEVDRVRLPQGLKDLKRVARAVGLAVSGAVLNVDAGFDSNAKRQAVFKAGLTPNRKENPRNRQQPKRGRKRFFAERLYTLRFTVERPFAWADKCKRLLLRFETTQIRHLGFKLLAFTLINLREFCGG